MRHRISAGVLIEDHGRILLVHHRRQGRYDFWVPPGGGVEGTEDLESTALREVREECGLEVELGRIAYIEDLYNSTLRICKVWFTGRIIGGTLNTRSAAAAAEHIVEAAFLGRDDFAGRLVYPTMLAAEYWEDRAAGFPEPRYVGLRRLDTDA